MPCNTGAFRDFFLFYFFQFSSIYKYIHIYIHLHIYISSFLSLAAHNRVYSLSMYLPVCLPSTPTQLFFFLEEAYQHFFFFVYHGVYSRSNVRFLLSAGSYVFSAPANDLSIAFQFFAKRVKAAPLPRHHSIIECITAFSSDWFFWRSFELFFFFLSPRILKTLYIFADLCISTTLFCVIYSVRYSKYISK